MLVIRSLDFASDRWHAGGYDGGVGGTGGQGQANGADLAQISSPISIATDGAFKAAFANLEIAGGGARDTAALFGGVACIR